MQNHQRCDVLFMGQPTYRRQQGQLMMWVQTGRGLIQHQHPVLIRPGAGQQQLMEHPGKLHPLLFPAG